MKDVTTIEETQAGELARLGEEFRKAHQELEANKLRLQATFKQSTAEAIACGKILVEAKKLVGHNGWMKWVKEHANISLSTAERYMHLARNSSSMTNLTTKTLTKCYTDLGLLKTPTSHSKSSQSSRPKPSEFVKAKGLSVQLWNLLIGTSDPDRMAKEIEGVINWHQDYLEAKKKKADAAILDVEFQQVS